MFIAEPSDPTLSPEVLAALSGTEDWLSSWTTTAILLGFGIVLLMATILLRRRWRHRLWRVVTIIVSVLSILAGSAIGVNTYSGYVPNVGAARLTFANLGVNTPSVTRDNRGGTTTPVQIPAPAADQMPDSTTWVYTPPGYDGADTSTRYPVVYLIHGTPGSSSDWFAGGQIAHTMNVLIEARVIRPMIVVAPDVNGTGPGANDTECLNSTTGGSQVESFLTDTVVTWIDAHYQTAADRSHRIIGGMSAGAYCSLDIGLRHNALFATILAIEGYPDPGDGGRAMMATEAEFADHTPSHYVPDLAFAGPMSIFMDMADSSEEERVTAMTTLGAQLTERGHDVVLRTEVDRDHTWAMARAAIPYGLVFASDRLP